MKKVDTTVFVGEKQGRIKPDEIDLNNLPPIVKQPRIVFPESRSIERTPERTIAQPFKRPDAQTHERSSVQGYRIIVRNSYDVFIDQAERIDELVLQRKKQASRHVTKGEVVREILDFFFERNK